MPDLLMMMMMTTGRLQVGTTNFIWEKTVNMSTVF
jgi:hypothetical protein